MEFTAIDSPYGDYVFKNHKHGYTFSHKEFNELYEIVENTTISDIWDKPSQAYKNAVDPNHRYGGMEDRLKQQFWFLEDCYYIEKDGNSHVIDARQPLENFFQQELERICEEYVEVIKKLFSGYSKETKWATDEIMKDILDAIKSHDKTS